MKWYKIAQENPLNEYYGDIPSNGGFGYATEYEIGISRIAEALHCIIGSLCKQYWRGELDKIGIEQGHIKEEFKLIKDCIEEYSRDLYNKRLYAFEEFRKYFDTEEEFLSYIAQKKEYAQKSIDSIRSNGETLLNLAQSKIGLLGNSLIERMAKQCYICLVALSQAAVKSVSGKVVENCLRDETFLNLVDKLGSMISQVLVRN